MSEFRPELPYEKAVELLKEKQEFVKFLKETIRNLLKDAERVEFPETKKIIHAEVDELEASLRFANISLEHIKKQVDYYKEKLGVD